MGPAMKVIDSFMYFNEKDIAYLRIKELYDTVDYFVVNEATKTHQSQEKELSFWKDDRLQEFKDKIIYSSIELDGRFNILMQKFFPDSNIGSKEHEQRIRLFEQIEALNLENSDIIMISDCDEIPNKNIFQQMMQYPIVALNQMFFVHYIDVYTNKNVTGTVACKYEGLKYLNTLCFGMGLQLLRRDKDFMPRIENGGWHYSYMGGAKSVSQKVVSTYDGNLDSPWKTEESAQKLIDESIQNKQSPFSQEPITILDFKYATISNLNFITAKQGGWHKESAKCQLHPKVLELDFNGEFENLRYIR
jgi:beta-1,4-mannosyl-glycoprotein beta-1,4-N-acetylglucosaminyltransferase